MSALCGTRIRYSRLHVHLIGGDLAGSIVEDGDSSDRRFYGVVDLVLSTYFTSLALEALDQFKGSMATILALGHWSLRVRCTNIPPTVTNNVRPTLV
jgi:hypothetical protein